MTRLSIWIVLTLSLVSSLMACSAMKPVLGSSSTEISINASTSSRVNLDAKKRSTPVLVRIYALKNLAAFNAADFFSLYEHDQQTLADSLIAREEIILRPGETKSIPIIKADQAAYVGVIAAFRDINHASWRTNAQLKAERLNAFKVNLDGNSVQLSNDR